MKLVILVKVKTSMVANLIGIFCSIKNLTSIQLYNNSNNNGNWKYSMWLDVIYNLVIYFFFFTYWKGGAASKSIWTQWQSPPPCFGCSNSKVTVDISSSFSQYFPKFTSREELYSIRQWFEQRTLPVWSDALKVSHRSILSRPRSPPIHLSLVHTKRIVGIEATDVLTLNRVNTQIQKMPIANYYFPLAITPKLRLIL